MTLEEVKTSNAMFLTPAQIAPILGCDPSIIRLQAHVRPELLGFPVVVMKSRTKIPRKRFLEWLGEA